MKQPIVDLIPPPILPSELELKASSKMGKEDINKGQQGEASLSSAFIHGDANAVIDVTNPGFSSD